MSYFWAAMNGLGITLYTAFAWTVIGVLVGAIIEAFQSKERPLLVWGSAGLCLGLVLVNVAMWILTLRLWWGA